MRALAAKIAEIYGRRWWVFALWYLEACAMVAALYTVARGGLPQDMLAPLLFLVACGTALALPAHALRLGLTALAASAGTRRLALQLFLAICAAATAASLSVQQGWAAIICILLVGDALWALELDLRDDRTLGGDDVPPASGDRGDYSVK
jgi:hypothetical protein